MSAPSTGKPEFIMTGVQRPGGGVRLYASRSLKDLEFGHDENRGGATALWQIAGKLDQMLIIDGDTWAHAFARMFEIWENQDRAKALADGGRRPEIRVPEVRGPLQLPGERDE